MTTRKSDSVASAVLSLVDASVLDAEYLIEYTATDIPSGSYHPA